MLHRYYEIREQIQTGDLLQWHSNSALGAGIRWKTRKDRPEYEVLHGIDVNHSSLAIKMIESASGDLRLHTTEAMEKGTVPAFLSIRLEQFDGSVWWYPLRAEYDHDRAEIGRRAFDHLGVPYDYTAIVKQLFGIAPKIDGKALYCNEYCCVSYGVDAATARNPNWMPHLGRFQVPIQIK